MPFKSATETSLGGDTQGGTGKPRKPETQIMVGALLSGNSTAREAQYAQINDCRPFSRVQNMAYKTQRDK